MVTEMLPGMTRDVSGACNTIIMIIPRSTDTIVIK